MTQGPQLFALSATRALGEAVAARLRIGLTQHEERGFEDGEHKTRPLESVRGRDVYVLQSLHGGPSESPHDKLCRALFFLGALRDAGAGRLTLLAPYLCYARKDRRTKSRDPVTTRYVAALVEAVGVDRVATLDVHNPAAFENAFRREAINLKARGLFVRDLLPRLGTADAVVVSPDAGGGKRAEALRQTLEQATGRPVGSGMMEKYRSAGVVSGEAFVGEVEGRIAVIVDDLISTGGTMLRCARACRERGAREVHAVATHGLFTGDAAEAVADPAFDRVVVTSSVPPFRLPDSLVDERLTVLDVAPLLAEAVRRLHEDGSINDLLEQGPPA